MINTPILFLIFNRADTTEKVFDEIRKAAPKKLYVAADGPRENNESDTEKCAKTRAIINVDWDCELITLFRDENLGCRKAVSEAITWFFNNEEQGIILEDDCLPHQSFFTYCEELLEYYKSEERVMLISGNNFQDGIKRGKSSYYFSNYSHIWGWASWRRAWLHYDVDMKSFPEFKTMDSISSTIVTKSEQKYWLTKFEKTYLNQINTWDYQWVFSIWRKKGLSILPNVNLISNIGFDQSGTHTLTVNIEMANLPIFEMKFPLIHPSNSEVNYQADEYTNRKFFKKSFRKKLKLAMNMSLSEIISRLLRKKNTM